MLSLAETFLLNNRVNLILLDAMSGEQLAHVPFPRARSIADQFAHLHNVRLMWLKVCGPELMKGIEKIEKDAAAEPRGGNQLMFKHLPIAGLLALATLFVSLEQVCSGPPRPMMFGLIRPKPKARPFRDWVPLPSATM